MFYWLVYCSIGELPEVEAAFSTPEALCRYVERIIDCSLVVAQYSVLYPNASPLPLKQFYDENKEI